MYNTTQVRNFVLVVAFSIIIQISHYQTVYTQELNAVNQIEGPFVAPLESKLRGSSIGLNQLERAVLARETQREIQNEIVRENQEQRLQEIVKERVFESTLPIEEAARVARSIIHGQTHGQLSTFLTENTAFDQSLVGQPLSSVELFVEDCGLGSGDLLVVGSELNSRNLPNEYSKATLLVQGNQKTCCERCMEQGLGYSPLCSSCCQKPWIHKSEVVVVGHLQKLDSVSDSFSVAKECVKAVLPEVEALEKVLPQGFGIWKLKVDSGVHLVDRVHKFAGWIPLDKFGEVVLVEQKSTEFSPKYESGLWKQRLDYPFYVASGPSREMMDEMNFVEMEKLRRQGYGLSPFAKRMWQMKRLGKFFPYNSSDSFRYYPQNFGGFNKASSEMMEPAVAVSTSKVDVDGTPLKEEVDATMVSTL